MGLTRWGSTAPHPLRQYINVQQMCEKKMYRNCAPHLLGWMELPQVSGHTTFKSRGHNLLWAQPVCSADLHNFCLSSVCHKSHLFLHTVWIVMVIFDISGGPTNLRKPELNPSFELPFQRFPAQMIELQHSKPIYKYIFFFEKLKRKN